MEWNKTRAIACVLILLALILLGCTQQANAPNNDSQKMDENISVYFLDVNQGDSIFIDANSGKMLIDCGEKEAGEKVSGFLRDKNVFALDFLVITHPHTDHFGGCAEVLENFDVKKVLVNGEESESQGYLRLLGLAEGNRLVEAQKGLSGSLGKAQWTVLHSNEGDSDPNQNSIVLMLLYGGEKFLFTGDCDRECENALLNEEIDSDVLKVAHHCSRYGTTEAFLQKATPLVAVIQSGKGNPYGHPNEECISRLEEAGVQVHRNDLEGDIEVKSDGLLIFVN
ncbi:MAG: MBL fold metallo-hydrolase [Candidatus Diapherotrites archaeon]